MTRRPARAAGKLVTLLEHGDVLRLRDRSFRLAPDEFQLLDPSTSDGRSRNVSFDPDTGRVSGLAALGWRRAAADRMIARFADWAEAQANEFLPSYAGHLQRARTSFHPCPVEDRPASPQADDRRLHIDAFRSQPTQGRRILRLFANVDPEGRTRDWRLGERFEAFAAKFHARIPPAPPGKALAMRALRLTRSRRTAYDHAMLALHDLAKLDNDYQITAPRRDAAFAAGTSWIVFTDAALHAAIAGQNVLEQTFLLPVGAMVDETLSPLRILERLMGRRLV